MLSSEFHSLNLKGALFLVGPAKRVKRKSGPQNDGTKNTSFSIKKDMIYFPSVKVCLQMDGQIIILNCVCDCVFVSQRERENVDDDGEDEVK